MGSPSPTVRQTTCCFASVAWCFWFHQPWPVPDQTMGMDHQSLHMRSQRQATGHPMMGTALLLLNTALHPAAETGLDLTTLIIPLLALVGLFLLFPTYVTLASVRRKREAGEEPTETKLVERLQDMYLAVIESEECVERIACEVGGIARDAGLDQNLVTAASYMVPTKYTKYAKQFATSRKCEKIKCGSF